MARKVTRKMAEAGYDLVASMSSMVSWVGKEKVLQVMAQVYQVMYALDHPEDESAKKAQVQLGAPPTNVPLQLPEEVDIENDD